MQADFLSTIIDYDDWYLKPTVFSWLESAWGPILLINLLIATTVSCLVSIADVGTLAQRQLILSSWIGVVKTTGGAHQSAWFPGLLGHAQVCRDEGTLIVPEWESAPFWPLLHPAVQRFADFVVYVQELPLSESLFLPGLSGFTLYNGRMPNTSVLAVRCNFARSSL